MKRIILVVLAVAASAGTMLAAQGGAQAQEAVSKAKAAAFDARMFKVAVTGKSAACFVRSYDTSHLAQHPMQKVSAMKLLVEAERVPETGTVNYAVSIGIQYRDRPGNFESGGYCGHVIATAAGHELRYECAADCEGGGMTVALSKDNKSAIMRVARIGISDPSKPNEYTGEMLVGSGDDKVFRVDRVDVKECAELMTDRAEVAAVTHE
ncbi:hypothetical protein IC762_27515 [Bradyrhizobium genosp. L]|uniref:hypothetical protein n=1 Tax=Bradyrhizobium genosp. L TaxID=83637 RepID=UPI0018A2962A|nr:hypothetical protein [Bradyrhizobium genosp. L]QPF83427.1 hypothetical protein IC762_27515 [Bradyrhizobium genosp. L]